MLEARAHLLACVSDACPAALRGDCLKRVDEIESSLPTVVFQARTPDGKDVTDVEVEIDGAPAASHLDGRPVEIDPGPRRVRFHRGGKVIEDQSILIVEGQKLRTVGIVVSRPPPPPPPAAAAEKPPMDPTPSVTRRSIPWPVYAFGGLGALALGSFSYFGLSGLSARADLYDCRPSCVSDDVERARTELLVADISLGVAVVAIGVAAYYVVAERPRAAVQR